MFKKFLKKLSRKADNAVIAASVALKNRKAEGYVDTGVKILIAVLVLTLLYALLKTTVMGTVTTKVSELFNYSGATT